MSLQHHRGSSILLEVLLLGRGHMCAAHLVDTAIIGGNNVQTGIPMGAEIKGSATAEACNDGFRHCCERVRHCQLVVLR